MTHLNIDTHLTKGHENHNELAASHEGMAHFAGTGPTGKVCSDCHHWHNGDERKKQGLMQHASPENAVCSKFVEFSLKTIRKPPKPPHDARACKYFEQYVDGGSASG